MPAPDAYGASGSTRRPRERSRWVPLHVLSGGILMVVLSTSLINVALPSVRVDLALSAETLVWILNAYQLTFGGFLLLGGRLCDLYGSRRIFLTGVLSFTVSSALCGIATSATWLIVSRAAQGLAGALLMASALSLITRLFSAPGDRAKAMGQFGFVVASGGALGAPLSGLLTGLLSWHWVFLVNLPFGIAVTILGQRLLPPDNRPAAGRQLDVGGAVTVTGGLVLATAGVLGAASSGWTSIRTLGLLGCAAVVLAVFVVLERRVRDPLVRFSLLRPRNVIVANLAGMLWTSMMLAWAFFTALYLHRVLDYPPLAIGLALMPAHVVMAVVSLKVSDRLVLGFGVRWTFVAGMALSAAGLLMLARVSMIGDYTTDVLPGLVLFGAGAGVAFNPLLLAALGDLEPRQAGLASGVMNTSFEMGGTLGLSLLVSLSAGRTAALLAQGSSPVEALHGGYTLAFAQAAVVAVGAVALGGILLRQPRSMASVPA